MDAAGWAKVLGEMDPHFWRRYPKLLDAFSTAVAREWERRMQEHLESEIWLLKEIAHDLPDKPFDAEATVHGAIELRQLHLDALKGRVIPLPEAPHG